MVKYKLRYNSFYFINSFKQNVEDIYFFFKGFEGIYRILKKRFFDTQKYFSPHCLALVPTPKLLLPHPQPPTPFFLGLIHRFFFPSTFALRGLKEYRCSMLMVLFKEIWQIFKSLITQLTFYDIFNKNIKGSNSFPQLWNLYIYIYIYIKN